jgi:demethylmenaquinone methyltransferase/2-methoxy-6-polyprenyl-1,4-benzoquinol methylase
LRKIILRGLLYDLFIEPLLKKTKEWIAGFIIQHDLFPALDICCGTGKQCQLAANGRQRVIGLDLDFKMIKHASSKYPQITFVCADAAHIPLRKKSLKAVIISYALHEKPRDLQAKILEEAKNLLSPEGRIIFVDFERPWNRLSRVGSLLTWSIERMAGGEHYRNSRQFLQEGGLQTYIKANRLCPIERHDITLANSSIVVAQFESIKRK